MMSPNKAQHILDHLVYYPGYTFRVVENGDEFHLLADFTADCGHWTTRKWRLSRHMTCSEVVQTAFKCVLTAAEHEVREAFKYKNKAIFGPHFDVEALHSICDQLEVRQ